MAHRAATRTLQTRGFTRLTSAAPGGASRPPDPAGVYARWEVVRAPLLVVAPLLLSLAAAPLPADVPIAETPSATSAPPEATDVKLALQSSKAFPRIGFL